ncbi:uncharacterized protein LOC119628837 [Bombyx mori]|uniref:Glycosyltransferase family 92 protein n=1 Tax=Bombyx mori TaxID=7091 RepID=A0A8R2LW11_BOMMO|nr:uncharacterized protein LOC119628837 [Bombyx mori]
MVCKTRKLVRVTKLILAGLTLICVSWIASVSEWHARVRWRNRQVDTDHGISTMRTIIAYSQDIQEEMDRPSPVRCDRLPAFPEVPSINRTWTADSSNYGTWQRVTGTKVSIYSAFYDNRTSQPYIRILAFFHGRNASADQTLFCQTRSLDPNENSVEVVAAKPLEIWWHEWDVQSTDIDYPFLLSCPLTGPLNGPTLVSLVTEPCLDPTNAHPLKHSLKRNQQKRMFTICVKDLNFDKDISQNLIEWIETNKILGVDIIDVYIGNISKEIESILQHYRDAGFIRLFHVPIRNKPERSLWQRRRDHIITYNDCLYRNIQESEFIIPLDIDEIVMPKTANSLPELLKHLVKRGWNPKEYSAIMIKNVFFFKFMQKINKNYYNYKNKSKTYAKRDDVRIRYARSTKILDENNSVHLFDKNKLGNKNSVDVNELQVYYENYNSRCGHDMPTSKLMTHVISSAFISPIGFYSKSFMVTERVLTAFNHYPLASLGTSGFDGWPAPFKEVQLNHYKESCNATVVPECELYQRDVRLDRTALRLRKKLIEALSNAICT